MKKKVYTPRFLPAHTLYFSRLPQTAPFSKLFPALLYFLPRPLAVSFLHGYMFYGMQNPFSLSSAPFT